MEEEGTKLPLNKLVIYIILILAIILIFYILMTRIMTIF